MKNRNSRRGFTQSCFPKGFTLIELLVVVLIIGILAAVAVPQYQKVVIKSRYMILKPLAKAIADAEEIYYLANGSYTVNTDELDIDWPAQPNSSNSGTGYSNYYFDWGYCSINLPEEEDESISNVWRVVCSSNSAQMKYRRMLQHSTTSLAGKQACLSTESVPATVSICQQESGQTEPHDKYGGYIW